MNYQKKITNTNLTHFKSTYNLNRRGVISYLSAAATITGGGSGITATVASITNPDLRNNFGDVLYVENRAPVSRAADQIEDIKLVVKF